MTGPFYKYALAFACLFAHFSILAQPELRLSEKVILGWNKNIETYFIAEKLAVQHIGNYVFSQKDSLYQHQPLVYEAYKSFKKYTHTSTIKRIAKLLKYFRDTYHDNAPLVQYMIYLRPFPEKGERFPFRDSMAFNPRNNHAAMTNLSELTDSLRSFYTLAHVNNFLLKNKPYYEGALREVKKDIRPAIFPAMESFYGEHFARYAIYIMPLMPITYGEDNYRAFGPVMHWPQGKVAGMVFSSSKMLPAVVKGKRYEFGFDNKPVTNFLTVHEFGHSFVNPHVDSLAPEVEKDTSLFTEELRKALEPSFIWNWKMCVIEHLVRLGEIRVAEAMKDTAEANRLRKLHIHDFKFVLLPLLEEKIKEYEANRQRYPDFASFLPQLLQMFHQLTPERVNALVSEMNRVTSTQ